MIEVTILGQKAGLMSLFCSDRDYSIVTDKNLFDQLQSARD